jgi:hypothetical protein
MQFWPMDNVVNAVLVLQMLSWVNTEKPFVCAWGVDFGMLGDKNAGYAFANEYKKSNNLKFF